MSTGEWWVVVRIVLVVLVFGGFYWKLGRKSWHWLLHRNDNKDLGDKDGHPE